MGAKRATSSCRIQKLTMSFQALVEASIQSTERYLEFLHNKNGGGISFHDAQRTLDITEAITNTRSGAKVHPACFETDRNLLLTPDSMVSFRCRGAGDVQLAYVLEYEPRTGELTLGFESPIDCQEGRLEIDLRWLVRRTLSWLQENRHKALKRQHSGTTSLAFDSRFELSANQEKALEESVKANVAYVWGPPGSGKTTRCLAALCSSLVRSEQRVLVTAPTNSGLDTALTAILESETIDRNEVIRFGFPTSEFRDAYPEVCEGAKSRIALADVNKEILQISERILVASDEEKGSLLQQLTELRNEIVRLLGDAVEGKSVLGMTLDGLLGRTLKGSYNVDWILLDEAAYAHAVKALPLFTMNCRITMFGDHRQLPPVCEADRRDSKINAYWGRSALYLDDLFSEPSAHRKICGLPEPRFRRLKLSSLTTSYRFDNRLAEVLDAFIYGCGLKGMAQVPTKISVRNVPPSDATPKRTSPTEATVACELALEHEAAGDNVAILTPYLDQRREIRRQLRKYDRKSRIEVLNTHKAQGREWDVVIFSVVDTLRTKNRPFFTNSEEPDGKRLLNTTISRVKQLLYIVCDEEYWRPQENQLIGQLIAVAAKN